VIKLREVKYCTLKDTSVQPPMPNDDFFYRPYIDDYQTLMILDVMQGLYSEKGSPIRCFEYGSGWSTTFLSSFIPCIWISIDHHDFFIEMLKGKLSINVTLVQKPIWSGYPEEIHIHGSKFDFVFVDGERREDCIFEAHKALRKGGIVVRHDAGLENEPIMHEGKDLRELFEENGVNAGLWWARK